MKQKEEDFVNLIRENEGIIFKITRIYGTDPEDARDLYQEVVFQLWKSFEKFRGESKISTWMYRVSLNTALTHSKKRKRTESGSLQTELLHLYEETDRILDERSEMLYRQIQSLNVVDKGIILLYLEGKSYEEISSITGFSASNVGTKLGRIRDKLRKKIMVS